MKYWIILIAVKTNKQTKNMLREVSLGKPLIFLSLPAPCFITHHQNWLLGSTPLHRAEQNTDDTTPMYIRWQVQIVQWKYENILLLDATCLINMSVAHLQHKLSRNLDNPPMDKSKVGCTPMQRLHMIPMVTENLQVLQKKCYL